VRVIITTLLLLLLKQGKFVLEIFLKFIGSLSLKLFKIGLWYWVLERRLRYPARLTQYAVSLLSISGVMSGVFKGRVANETDISGSSGAVRIVVISSSI